MPAAVKKTQLNRKDAKNAKIRKVKMEIEETAQVIVDSAMQLMKFGIGILEARPETLTRLQITNACNLYRRKSLK